jgi:hypothetical protein
MILPISASQLVRITGISLHAQLRISFSKYLLILEKALSLCEYTHTDVHTIKHYLAIKRNEILSFSAIYRELKDIK